MLITTRTIRESPPSYNRNTVGSTSRTRYVAKMKEEVTSRTSDTSSVSVPTGIKTLNRRIIERPGAPINGKVNYTRDCGASQPPNTAVSRQSRNVLFQQSRNVL